MIKKAYGIKTQCLSHIGVVAATFKCFEMLPEDLLTLNEIGRV